MKLIVYGFGGYLFSLMGLYTHVRILIVLSQNILRSALEAWPKGELELLEERGP
jgi:hypothetical protein